VLGAGVLPKNQAELAFAFCGIANATNPVNRTRTINRQLE
jgi:hypothetical protein